MSFKKIVNKYFSRKSDINFIFGARGIGKTFTFKNLALKEGIKNKKTTIFVRRFKKDVVNFKNNFFNDLEYKKTDFKIVGNTIFHNEYPIIVFISLNESSSFKGALNYKNPFLIIFDEIDTLSGVYAKNEVYQFLDILESFFRDKKRCCFLLSNLVNANNPFFEYFKIDNLTDKIKTKNKISYAIFNDKYKYRNIKYSYNNEKYNNYLTANEKKYKKIDLKNFNTIFSFYYLGSYFNLYYDDNIYYLLASKTAKAPVVTFSKEIKGIPFSFFKTKKIYNVLKKMSYLGSFQPLDRKSDDFIFVNF